MKVIKPFIFIAAFILVSGALIYLNSMYTNIFKFDFSTSTQNTIVPDTSKSPGSLTDSSMTSEDNNLLTDSSLSAVQKDSSLIKSEINKINEPEPGKPNIILPAVKNIAEITDTASSGTVMQRPLSDGRSMSDTVYVKWIKATAAMYESMEPKKAAKIIQNYPENVARDIIYRMKKKKAAEVLAELDPVVANRITEYW